MAKKIEDKHTKAEVWKNIECGIYLTKKRFPHISNIKLTEDQKRVLINFYSEKKYIDYCAKFEEYFLITEKHINDGQISKRINGVGTPDEKE